MERTLIVCWCKRVCRQKTDLLRIRQRRIAYYLAHILCPHPQRQYHSIAAGDPQKEPGAYLGRAQRLFRKSLTLISEEPNAYFGRAQRLSRKSPVLISEEPGAYFGRA